MVKVSVVVKLSDDRIEGIACKVISLLLSKNIQPLMLEDNAKSYNIDINFSTIEEMRRESKFVIVLGGDGTLLHALQLFVEIDVPILPFNLGRVGFIMELQLDDLENYIDDAINDKLIIRERMRLESKIYNGDNFVTGFNALNEIVINKAITSKILEITVENDLEMINRFRADGLIVSTPTGSTGYALSSGGPIIHPKLNVILIVPICPHTLYIRPIVIPADSELKISIKFSVDISKSEASVTHDGQVINSLNIGDVVTIRRSPKPAQIVTSRDKSFYSVLKNKLGWGTELC